MADLFNRQNDAYGGSFASDGASVTFPQVGALAGVGPSGGVGLLVQNLQLSYAQMVTRIYELGTSQVYYVGGRSQGSMGMGRIVGPRAVQLGFYQQFGDVCNADLNQLQISVRIGCPTALPESANAQLANQGKALYTAKFAVITTIGLAVAAMDMVINEQLQMLFGALTLSD